MNQRLMERGVGRLVPVTPGSGVFVGYASLFHRRDSQGDIVMPGAFAATLKLKGVAAVRMLFQHDPAEPIGTWIDIKENPHGLFVRGRIDRNVQRGRELISLLETGGIDGLSIGFRTVQARQDRVLKARRLLQIDLWEISLVTFPMLEGARVSTPKAASRALAERFFKPGPQQRNPTFTQGVN